MFGFLKKVFKKVKSWFDNLFDLFSEEGYAGVVIINMLKDLVESPLTNAIVNMTPTPVDNYLVAKGKRFLPDLAYAYGVAHGLVKEDDDRSGALLVLLDYIESLDKSNRISVWITLSAQLIRYLSGYKISEGEATVLGQRKYIENFGKPSDILLAA